MTPTEAKLAAVLAPELKRRIYTLTRKLMKMEAQRDEWRAYAQKYQKQLKEKNDSKATP